MVEEVPVARARAVPARLAVLAAGLALAERLAEMQAPPELAEQVLALMALLAKMVLIAHSTHSLHQVAVAVAVTLAHLLVVLETSAVIHQ